MLQSNEVEIPPTALWPWIVLVSVPVVGFALILWLMLPRRHSDNEAKDPDGNA